MTHKELQNEIDSWEFKVKTGQYDTLRLNNDYKYENITVFEIRFTLNFNTYLFCKRTIEKGLPTYEVDKIVTIPSDGNVKTFNSIKSFIDYIKTINEVELVHKYR